MCMGVANFTDIVNHIAAPFLLDEQNTVLANYAKSLSWRRLLGKSV
jgi:hypothetical protein